MNRLSGVDFGLMLPPLQTPNDVEWHGRLFNRHEKDAVRRLATAIYFVNKWVSGVVRVRVHVCEH